MKNPTKTRLILLESKDPEPSSSRLHPRATYRDRHFSLVVFVAASVVAGIVFFAPLFAAQAGLLSFVERMLGAETAKELQQSENSQNMALLRAALNVDPNPAKGGGDITVVGGSALLSQAGPSGTNANLEEGTGGGQGNISLYVVREGDTLSQIADMFDVTTGTIIWANDISRGDLVRVGQTLVILPVSGVRHEIEEGDTIGSIAKEYDGSAEEILEFNDIADSSTLAVGDELIIPGGEISAPAHTHTHSTHTYSQSAPSYEGYYMRPVAGGTRTQGLHGYNGIDIAASPGTPIYAAASGVVIINKSYGWNGGYGKYVAIRHNNGTQTLYAHNSSNIVSVGQHVVQGQIIGYMGSTGRSTGPHVHFEVRGARNPF